MDSNGKPKWWSQAPLAEMTIKLVDGSHNPPAKRDTGRPMLSAINISENKIHFSSYRFISDESFVIENQRTQIQAGDILLTIVGAIGRAAVVPTDAEPFALQRSVAVIRPALIDPKFLMYQFESPRVASFFKVNARGTAQKGVYLKTLGTTDIWFPSLSEQSRIVAKIEELFSELDKGVECLTTARDQLRAYRQAVLKHGFEGNLTKEWRQQNAKELESTAQLLSRVVNLRNERYDKDLKQWETSVKQWKKDGEVGPKPSKPAAFKPAEPIHADELSRMPEIPSGWKYVRLSNIAQIGSGMSVSGSRKLASPIEVAYLRVANVQRGYLDLKEIKTMRIERSQLTALELKEGDVLFNEGGDRDKLGRGWVWQCQIEPCITQNHVFRASPYVPSDHHSKWISHWGNAFGQSYFETQGKQTTNLASINRTVLSNFPVPVAPLEEQEEAINRIESQLAVADHLENDIIDSLERLAALRQSILKRAFSGDLVEQNPADECASILLQRIRAINDTTQRPNRKKRTTAA